MKRVDLSINDIKKMNMYDYANKLCRENDQFNLIKSEFLTSQLKRDLLSALSSGDEESLEYITELCKYVELMSRKQYMYTSLINALSTAVNKYALGHCKLSVKIKSIIDTFTVQLGKSSGEDLQKFINNFQIQKELNPTTINQYNVNTKRVIPLQRIMYDKSIEILFDNFVDKTIATVLMFTDHLKFDVCDHDNNDIEKLSKQFSDLKSSQQISTENHNHHSYVHKYSNLHEILNGHLSNNTNQNESNIISESDNISESESIITTIYNNKEIININNEYSNDTQETNNITNDDNDNVIEEIENNHTSDDYVILPIDDSYFNEYNIKT